MTDVKRFLRTVSRGLLAATVLSAFIVLCPCAAGVDMAADDCCPQADLAIGAACCDRAPAPSIAAAPASALGVLLAPASFVAAMKAPLPVIAPGSPHVFARLAVAHTILRI